MASESIATRRCAHPAALACSAVFLFCPSDPFRPGHLLAPTYLPSALQTAESVSSITGDPHVHGADGDHFDFKGVHGGIYVLLSATNLSLAASFEHESFRTPYSKLNVQGAWIRRAYWTIRTACGRMLKLDLDARRPAYNGSTTPRTSVIDDVRIQLEGNHGHAEKATLTVPTRTWRTRALVTKGAPHWGMLRIHMYLQPMTSPTTGLVAPHGLIGQTYDGDGRPTHGQRDRYDTLDNGMSARSRSGVGGTVTTRAQGEGAIEGTAEMYRIQHPHSTSFDFSRFDPVSALPRNISRVRRYINK